VNGRDAGDPPPRRRVTSADVARASGVSRATVSYVLNNADRPISETTRSLVLETAERLGHIPYAPARALRSGRLNVVLGIVAGFSVGFVADLTLDRLNREVGDRGYAFLVTRLTDEKEGLNIRELWGAVTPTLVLAMGGLPAHARELIDRSQASLVEDVGIFSYVDTGRMQAEYLADGGHRVLGFGYPQDPNIDRYARQRLEGVRQVCAERGMGAPLVDTIGSDVGAVVEALRQWRAQGVTAICAHNDDVALIVLAAMAVLGWTPGLDMSVIGVDDVPLANIGLSTVRIDAEAFMDALIERVVAALEDREPAPQTRPILSLVPRDSTRPLV
jgi:DNA-binding LacI/PurR family transcriptional regulator